MKISPKVRLSFLLFFSSLKVPVALRLNAKRRRLLEIQNFTLVYTVGLSLDPMDRSPFGHLMKFTQRGFPVY